MSTLSQFAAGGIKSIQRGTITLTNGQPSTTATITAVNTAKTMLNYLGTADGYSNSFSELASARINLTSSTQVTATAPFGGYSPSYPATVSYEVIEYF